VSPPKSRTFGLPQLGQNNAVSAYECVHPVQVMFAVMSCAGMGRSDDQTRA
jgi:hypothetical protein